MRGQVKYINSTNPTSETSSIKDSSIVSNQESKNKESRQNDKEENILIKGSHSHKSHIHKNTKPLKSDRPKYIEHDEESKKIERKSKSPSNSMWNQDIDHSIFLPKEPKKAKKKTVKKKTTNRQSKTKLSLEPKEDISQKQKLKSESEKPKDTKDIGIEEKKIDLNFKPSSTQVKSNLKIKQNPDYEEETKESKENAIKSIPSETVSSFYQVDPNSSPKFDKHHSYPYNDHHSKYYSYNNDHQYPYHKYSNFSGDDADFNSYNYQEYYDAYEHEYYNQKMTKSHSSPAQTADVYEAKQYESERILYEIIAKEIDQKACEITEQCNKITNYRFEIKSHIDEVVYQTFSKSHPQVEAHIYGSVFTGLMLPESDMDIVVTGINNFGFRENHTANISILYDNILKHFSSKLLVKSSKILYTQVPILKLTFSLTELFNESVDSGLLNLEEVDFESINPCLKELAVDISICDSYDSSDHQGIRAAYFVQNCINEYPVLKPVCLILK